MADQKISADPSATDLVGAVVPIVQGGVNKKADASLFGGVDEWTPASASAPASLDFYEDTDNGVHRGRLTAPSSLAADRTWTMPDTDLVVATAAVAGSTQSVDWLWGDTAARTALINEAGIWASKVASGVGIAKDFDSSFDSVSPDQGPNASLFVLARATGANNDIVAILGDAIATVNDAVVFGSNIIARTEAAVTNVKVVGLEVDVVPATGVTLRAGSAGLVLNTFNEAFPGPAIVTGAVGGGTFQNGLVLGGIASSGAGIAPNGAATMDSLISTGAGVFGTAAVIFSNTHRAQFKGTASAHAAVYNSSGNAMRIVGGSANTSIRNNADSASLLTVADAGLVTVAHRVQINGGSTDAISLAVLKTSAGSATANILAVLSNNASVTYFAIDPNGAALHKAPASTDLSVVYDVTTAGQTVQNIFRDAGVNIWFYRKTTGNQIDWYSSVLSATVLTIKDTGAIDVHSQIQIAGTKVVGARDTGWTAMTGSPDEATAYATGTVTLPQLAGRVAAIQAALTTHGLIGA